MISKNLPMKNYLSPEKYKEILIAPVCTVDVLFLIKIEQKLYYLSAKMIR